MKFLKKIFIFILFLYIIIAFFPKKNLYFLLENELFKHNIILFDEKLQDFGISFLINEANVSYQDINIGKIESLNLLFGIFYNEVKSENIVFKDSIKRFVPQKINSLRLIYTPFYPTKAWIFSDGDFGEISGDISFIDKKLKIVLKPSKEMGQKYPMILSNFKLIEGEYIYEQSFK